MLSHSEDSKYNHVHQCRLTKDWVNFFRRFIEYFDKPGRTSCQVIAAALLRNVVPSGELKNYSFNDKVGHGIRGIVFSGSYKHTPIVVKIQRLAVPGQHTNKVTVGHSTFYFDPVPEQVLKREQYIPQLITSRVSALETVPLRVPRVFSSLSKVWAKDKSMRIGVFTMEKLPLRPGYNYFFTKDQKLHPTRRGLQGYASIPYLVFTLHKISIVHMDLHLENVMFDGSVPCIFDFGRSLDLSTIGNTRDVALLKLLDYLVPLYSMANVDSSVDSYIAENCATFLNAYAKKLPLKILSTLVEQVGDSTLAASVNLLYRMCQERSVGAVVHVRNTVAELTNRPMFSDTRNYFDMVDL